MKAKIVYEADEIDTGLDEELIEVMKDHGWIWWASGYDLTTNERDLAFDRNPVPWLDEDGRSILDGSGLS